MTGLARLARSRFARADGASVTVEFVATLPMLLAALAITFEFGRGLWYHHIVTKGVRDATRYAARYPGLGADCGTLGADAAFVGAVRHVALSGTPNGTASPAFWTDPSTVSVETTPSALDLRTPTTCMITVRAEVPYNFSLLTVFDGLWQVDPVMEITVQDEARYIGD